MLRSFEKCSALFGLIDARESLGLETSRIGGYPRLEFAELLASPWILLDCFHSYTYVELQNFAPTDSLLLLFYDEVSVLTFEEITGWSWNSGWFTFIDELSFKHLSLLSIITIIIIELSSIDIRLIFFSGTIIDLTNVSHFKI